MNSFGKFICSACTNYSKKLVRRLIVMQDVPWHLSNCSSLKTGGHWGCSMRAARSQGQHLKTQQVHFGPRHDLSRRYTCRALTPLFTRKLWFAPACRHIQALALISAGTMRSPRRSPREHRVGENLQTRLRKTFFGLVCIVAVVIAFSAVPFLHKDLRIPRVPLQKVISYEANILLMESGIGLGKSFSSQAGDQEYSKNLRHVIVFAQSGALPFGLWCYCVG